MDPGVVGDRRPHWVVLAVPIGVVTVLGLVGTALTPPLATRHPLVLLILEARDRNLLLARHVSIVPYVLVGTVRRLCTDPAFYLLGRYYGPSAIAWLERSGGGRMVSVTERAFRRAAYPMLVIFPGAVVCTLAGEVGVPPVLFGVVVGVRTVIAVLVIRFLGDVFAGPIDATLAFFDRNLLVVSLVSIGSVVVWVVAERTRSSRSRRNEPHPEPADEDPDRPNDQR